MNTSRHALTATVRAALGAVALTLAAAGIAGAQQAPAPPAPSTAPPTYATPASGEQVTGTIAAITGKYTLQVRDARGFLDNITLHPGTIINPTGLQLTPGMQVAITGENAGATFTANQIDAPYAIALVARPVYDVGIGFGGWGWGRYRGGFLW